MNGLTGTAGLVRLALRRDRILLPVWIAVFATMAAGSAAATVGLFPTVASRVQAAESMNRTQSLVALYGRVYDPTSLGAIALVKMGGLGALLVAVVAILGVLRHTRAEEEAGRLELVGGAAVGRYAPLSAALLVAVGANVVLAVVTAFALVGAGLPADGSFAFGFAWAGVGVAFAAVAAVAAQVTVSTRTAAGLASGALGFVYVLRAVGDTAGPTGPSWLTWLSPIGWGQQFRPFAGNRWWVLLITAGFAAAVAAGAYLLAGRRDLGAGVVPDRAGPATAGARLRSPLALAWRLHRGALLGWALGFALLGLVLGNIATSVAGFVDTAQVRDMITKLGGQQGLTDAFLALEFGFTGVAAAAYAIQVAMRLRAEETALHAEAVLATATGRIRWAASHITMAVLGTAALMAAVGTGAGVAYAARTGNPGQIGRVLGAAFVQLPAAWVLVGIVVLCFGVAPRLVAVGWAALVGFLLLGELGPLLKLDQWVLDVSPFTHVPRLPGGALSVTPILTLTVIAALLTAVGLVGWRRRDVG